MGIALIALCSCVDGRRPLHLVPLLARQAQTCRIWRWAAELCEVLLCITKSAHVSSLQGALQGTVLQALGLLLPALICSAAWLAPATAMCAKRLRVLSMPKDAENSKATSLQLEAELLHARSLSEAPLHTEIAFHCPAESSGASCFD